MAWHHWLRLYRLHMPHNGRRERLFLTSLAFAITFILTRGLTLAIRNHVGPFQNVSVGGTHVHHLVHGILLLLLAGVFGQPIFSAVAWEFRAMLRGAGEAERIAHLEYERIRHGMDSGSGQHPQQPVDGPA